MEKKIEIIPYLSFHGNCEEALKTYIEAFGGEIYGMSRWSEETYEVTPEQIPDICQGQKEIHQNPPSRNRAPWY